MGTPLGDGAITPIPLSGQTDPTIIDAPLAAAQPFEIPEMLDHYKLVRQIGEGGMGRVLKCLDTRLNRYVAVKVLHPRLAGDPGFIARFEKEALAVAKLRHPNIVQIFSIGSVGPLHYFVMEYVDGEGLDRVLSRRERMPEREAVQVTVQVCRALQTAHEADILHRDVKPGNVLVDTTGRAMLSDFGLAKFVYQQTVRRSAEAAAAGSAPGGDLSQTDPGRIMGTPYYMAPEVIQGREPDARADVYATGVLLYELLTGRVPFTGDRATRVFEAHVHELPPTIAEIVPGVSLETARIVYRALEKEPGQRFPDAAAMAAALEATLDRERRAKELEARAQLGAEMATAFGSMRLAERRPNRWLRLASLALLLALGIATMVLVMESFKMPGQAGEAGSADGDTAFILGRPARVGGVVQEVVTGNDEARVLLVGSDRERWVRIPPAAWLPLLDGPPKPEQWWVADGMVEAAPSGPPQLCAAEGRMLAVRPFSWLREEVDPAEPGGRKFIPAGDADPADLGRRLGVCGTIVALVRGGRAGEVRLLLAADAQATIAVVLPGRLLQRLTSAPRVGDTLTYAIGRYEDAGGDEEIFAPGRTVTVEDPADLRVGPFR